MTAPDFAALVAAVLANEPHDPDCDVRLGYKCDCTREARACAKVGRGVAWVRESDRLLTDNNGELDPSADAAAARAFAEASRGS